MLSALDFNENLYEGIKLAGALKILLMVILLISIQAVGLILNLPQNEDVAVLLAIGTAPSNAAEEKKANPFPKYNMTVEDLVTTIR